MLRLHAMPARDVINIVIEDLTPNWVLHEKLTRAQQMEAVGRMTAEVALTCVNLLREATDHGRRFIAKLENGSDVRRSGEHVIGEVDRVATSLRQLARYADEQAMFTVLMFNAIGINAETLVANWLLPCGIAGALLVGSWLVEAKQSVIENMAPVLTRVFTPFFTILLLTFLATMAWTGKPIDVQRNVLIAFDLLLVLVVGLVLYAASARDLHAGTDWPHAHPAA